MGPLVKVSRRTAVLGLAATAAAGLAGSGGAVRAQQPERPRVGVGWGATSPWTHGGDHYRLVLTNGSTAQRVWVRVVIMDHRAGVNTAVVMEQLSLAANETREVSATNSYGEANHFNTAIGAEDPDLTFEVTITDGSGAETARFNQRAFGFRQGRVGGRPAGQSGPGQHGHGSQGSE